jgi:hypothetical protein
MDVDECISRYVSLMKQIFGEQSRRIPLSWRGRIRARFDSTKLKAAIEEVIASRGLPESELLNDQKPRGCRV